MLTTCTWPPGHRLPTPALHSDTGLADLPGHLDRSELKKMTVSWSSALLPPSGTTEYYISAVYRWLQVESWQVLAKSVPSFYFLNGISVDVL